MSIEHHHRGDWKPQTAREIVESLPSRYLGMDPLEAISTRVHLSISGDRGGDFTVVVDHESCRVEEGLNGSNNCVIKASDKDYEDLEWGRLNAKTAFFLGKIRVSNPVEVLKFVHAFRRLNHGSIR